MVTKSVRILMFFVLVALSVLSIPGALSAAEPDGTGPESAFYPADTWRSLNPGETHWYMFRDKGKDAQILVDLQAVDLNGLTFEVWTEGNHQMWAKGREFDPVGRGSINPYKSDALIWAGNFNMSGNCLVLVKNSGTTARDYKLEISGRDVYFPTAPAVAAAPRAVEKPVETSAVMAAPAMVDVPMAIDGEWMELAANETHWFAFNYEGKNKDILIRMKEETVGRATFAVYTPAQYADKMAGKTVEPVGRSSEDPFKSNAVYWFGSFPSKGTYYVEIIHTSQNADCSAYCALSIVSDGLIQ